jgi:hypothetical protein
MAMVKTETRGGRASGRLLRLGIDSRGQVSFSVIAVALLVSSAIAGTYIASNQLEQKKDERRLEMIEAMESSLTDLKVEFGLCAAARAQEIMKAWNEFPINETHISDAFGSSMREYIDSSFPRSSGNFLIEVANWTGGLYFVEQNTLDLIPSDATTSGTLEVSGVEVEYQSLPRACEESLGVVTVNPYYLALGNFSAKASTDEVTLSRSMSFQRPVVSALPFIESRLRMFEASSSGECSDLAKLVSGMLSTLAELRVLEGYGQPMYTSGMDTSEVITESDVYRAVAVSLLIEQVRLFRSFDASFASDVDQLCAGSGPGLTALAASKGRSLEPGELFLWFLGKTKASIDPTTLVAEAVFGFSDQLVLKFMEYMGWLGTLNLVKESIDLVVSSVDSVIALLTGEDKAKSAVTAWIRNSLRSSTSDPANCTYLFAAAGDCSVYIPERVYYVEDAASNLYPVWLGNATAIVDIPQYDLMSSDVWKDFYPDYKGSQADARQLSTDSVMRIAFDVASAADIRLDDFVIDPTDGRDLFTQLAESAGALDVDLDPDVIVESGRDLPLFSAQYELASRFSEFTSDKRLSLIDLDALENGGLDCIAEAALDSARYSYIPDLIVPVEQQLAEIVRSDIESDSGWDVGRRFSEMLIQMLDLRLDSITRLVNCSVYRIDDGFAGPMVDSLAATLAFGAGSFPGIEKLLERSLSEFARSVLRQEEFSGAKGTAYVDTRGQFEFWEGDRATAESRGKSISESVSVDVVSGLPDLQAVPFDPDCGYTSLEHLFPTDNLLVQIKMPSDFDTGKSEYPNTHLTDLSNMSCTPYSTQWTISVLGLIQLRTRTNNSELQTMCSEAVESQRSVRIELSFPIVVHSAWPLQGVEYEATNTILSDALEVSKKFGGIVWDKIGPIVGWLKDGLERIYGFVSRVFDVLSSFANRVIQALTSALETLVENLQEFVQKVADSVLGQAVKLFIDLTGRIEARISMYGFVIIIQTNLPDLIYKHGSDLLRIMVYTDRLGPGITMGVRIARLSDGSYDILANGTVALKNAVIEVAIDPLMHILRRLVEAHCTGNGWGLDIVIPEVEPYELADVSTSDIPIVGDFLSNIPIPGLGLSASIEAGIKLKYSSPFPTDIVVNEFESNPQGEDSGKEWVELYNPLDKPKSVDGWMLSTLHGKNSELTLSGAIPPNGVEVFTFPETSIDNGDPDDPFNNGDSILLQDAAGVTVDATPMLRDTANDARTIQRSWDGGPKWVLKEGSKDNSNGLPVLLASSDFIAKALFEAFRESFLETKLEEVTASLDFVCLFAKRVLNNFIENLLDLVKEIVHEVIFYLKVVLSDASGTAGTGFRASFVVTGDAIVDLLRWLIHSLATFVVNLGRAQTPLAYPQFPKSFFAGLYLRFEVLFEVGLPKMLSVIGAVSTIRDSYCMAISISPNMPAIGRLIGRNWGNWSVDFGAYLEAVPKEFGSMLFTVDTGDLMDFWLVKGRLYGT